MNNEVVKSMEKQSSGSVENNSYMEFNTQVIQTILISSAAENIYPGS